MGRRPIALVLVGALVVFARPAPSTADPYLPDAVSVAIAEAGEALNRGQSRSDVLAKFRAATAAVRDSKSFQRHGAALLRDLEAAVEREAASGSATASPEAALLNSRWRPRVWQPEMRERESVGEMFRTNPDDPAKALLLGNRDVIGRLLPLLDDRSPTRAFTERDDLPGGEYPVIPRVCDLAVSIVQFHGRVWFFDQFAFRELLHERREETQAQVAANARAWWRSVKDLTVADGIRHLLPTAGFYEKASMAENLIALGRESADKTLEAEGRRVILEMFSDSEGRAGHLGAYLAETLERYGDTTPVEEVYQRLAAARGKTGDAEPGLVFYLIRHATRREWELLTALAVEGYAAHRDGNFSSTVGMTIVNSEAGNTALWAVPALALALDRIEESGSRSVPGVSSQTYSIADKAVEQIQTVTGVNLGYRANGTPAERRESIERARKWWRDEGAIRYTFDGIEALLQKKAKSGR